MPTKTQGLILDVPGAPSTPHFIPGVQGLYRPQIPTPLEGLMTIEKAREIDADDSIPLKLAPIVDLADALSAAESATSDSKSAQRKARRARPKGAEAALINDEIDATKGAN